MAETGVICVKANPRSAISATALIQSSAESASPPWGVTRTPELKTVFRIPQ
jgi:hypothetical protein